MSGPRRGAGLLITLYQPDLAARLATMALVLFFNGLFELVLIRRTFTHA
jgi:hypothetical protein